MSTTTTTTKPTFKQIIDHICRPRAGAKPMPAKATKPAPVTAPTAQKTQVEQIADGVMLAREVQIELARRLAPTAAATAAVAKPQPTAAKPQAKPLDGAAQARAYSARKDRAAATASALLLGSALAAQEKRRPEPPADPGAGLSGPALLDKYMSVDASEARAILATHGEELKAAAEAAGIELDVGQHRNLTGTERAEAALRRQFPARKI